MNTIKKIIIVLVAIIYIATPSIISAFVFGESTKGMLMYVVGSMAAVLTVGYIIGGMAKVLNLDTK